MPEHLNFTKRKEIESYRKIGEDILFGEVKIDTEKCIGCQLCVSACAASSIEVVDKKAKMVLEMTGCISCGDCVAICPEGAISVVKYIEFRKAFRYLDRGKPSMPRAF